MPAEINVYDKDKNKLKGHALFAIKLNLVSIDDALLTQQCVVPYDSLQCILPFGVTNLMQGADSCFCGAYVESRMPPIQEGEDDKDISTPNTITTMKFPHRITSHLQDRLRVWFRISRQPFTETVISPSYDVRLRRSWMR